MIRIVSVIVIAMLLGVALGNLQVHWSKRGVVEQFQVTSLPGSDSGGQKMTDRVVGVPKLETPDGYKFQFGQMQHGSSMSHDFLVRNVGDAPLTLEQTGSTCKCTVGKLNNNVLKPGEETYVTLTWRAQTVTPTFGQSATFKTNDPLQSELQFQIEGAVIDSFVFEPSTLDLGDFMSDVGVSREFMVYCYTDADVELTQVEWSEPMTAKSIQLSYEPVAIDQTGIHAKATRSYRVKLEAGSGLRLGLISSKVLFRTNQGEQIDAPELQVNGRVVSEISVVGGTAFKMDRNILDLGTVSAKEGLVNYLYLVLRGSDREGVEVTVELSDPTPSMNVTVGEPKILEQRTMIPIQFEVPKGAPEVYYPGTGKGAFADVLIRTTSSKLRELPIHVKLVVRP